MLMITITITITTATSTITIITIISSLESLDLLPDLLAGRGRLAARGVRSVGGDTTARDTATFFSKETLPQLSLFKMQ